MEFCDIGVQTKIFLFFRGCAGAKLIEDVIISFREGLEDNTRTLKEVGADTCTNNFLLAIEEDLFGTMKTHKRNASIELTDLNIFSESGGVVVTRRLCVSEGFKDRICCQDLPFDFTRLVEGEFSLGLGFRIWWIDRGKVSHDEFRLIKVSTRSSRWGVWRLTDSVFPAPLHHGQ